MTTASGARGSVAGLAATAVIVVRSMCGPVAAQEQPKSADAARPAPQVNALAASVVDFQQRLDKYLELREGLSKKLKPLSPTADAAELAARQESLAAALRQSRKGAKQGDLVPADVGRQIGAAIAEDFRKRAPADTRATLQEVPSGLRPMINRTYPQQAALPTVPPLLLNSLPRLPDNLQYRFFGRHLLIVDGDTQIIIDYVANVVPPH